MKIGRSLAMPQGPITFRTVRRLDDRGNSDLDLAEKTRIIARIQERYLPEAVFPVFDVDRERQFQERIPHPRAVVIKLIGGPRTRWGHIEFVIAIRPCRSEKQFEAGVLPQIVFAPGHPRVRDDKAVKRATQLECRNDERTATVDITFDFQRPRIGRSRMREELHR